PAGAAVTTTVVAAWTARVSGARSGGGALVGLRLEAGAVGDLDGDGVTGRGDPAGRGARHLARRAGGVDRDAVDPRLKALTAQDRLSVPDRPAGDVRDVHLRPADEILVRRWLPVLALPALHRVPERVDHRRVDELVLHLLRRLRPVRIGEDAGDRELLGRDHQQRGALVLTGAGLTQHRLTDRRPGDLGGAGRGAPADRGPVADRAPRHVGRRPRHLLVEYPLAARAGHVQRLAVGCPQLLDRDRLAVDAFGRDRGVRVGAGQRGRCGGGGRAPPTASRR